MKLTKRAAIYEYCRAAIIEAWPQVSRIFDGPILLEAAAPYASITITNELQEFVGAATRSVRYSVLILLVFKPKSQPNKTAGAQKREFAASLSETLVTGPNLIVGPDCIGYLPVTRESLDIATTDLLERDLDALSVTYEVTVNEPVY